MLRTTQKPYLPRLNVSNRFNIRYVPKDAATTTQVLLTPPRPSEDGRPAVASEQTCSDLWDCIFATGATPEGISVASAELLEGGEITQNYQSVMHAVVVDRYPGTQKAFLPEAFAEVAPQEITVELS